MSKKRQVFPEWAVEIDTDVKAILKRLGFKAKGQPYASRATEPLSFFYNFSKIDPADDVLDTDTLLDGVAYEIAKYLTKLAQSGRLVQAASTAAWRGTDVHQVQADTRLQHTKDYIRASIKRYDQHKPYFVIEFRVEAPRTFEPEAPQGIKKITRIRKGSA